MRWTHAVVALILGGVQVVQARVVDGRQSDVPGFALTLRPVFKCNNYTMEGKIVVDGVFASNASLMSLPITIANAPSAQYPPDGLLASDGLGTLELGSYDAAVGPYGLPTRYWLTKRATAGPVTVQFTAYPEHVNASAQIGPLFGLRNQTDGLIGSLWAIIPTPNPLSGAVYDVSLTWDIPDILGAGWTWGDGVGPISFTGTLDQMLRTFFAVGKLSRYPAESGSDSSKFSMYWFDDPPFSIRDVAGIVETFFNYSIVFWQDTSSDPYRIFIRRDEEWGSGGTAVLHSFMFGYFNESGVTDTRLKTLLCHEMTHNWPRLSGTNAESSRYSEGIAEYYSLRLLWRSGIFSAAEFASEMNSRIYDYYYNPTVGLSDQDAMDIAWQTRPAQTIPYGRGLIHFTNIDAQMRAKSNGTESLDKLALDFLNQCRAGGTCDNPALFVILQSELGEGAVDEWNQVSTGMPLIVPQEGSLGPCFNVVQNNTSPAVYQWVAKAGVDISSDACKI